MLYAFPHNSGHLMIAPHRHVASIEHLDDYELLELRTLTRRAWAKRRDTERWAASERKGWAFRLSRDERVTRTVARVRAVAAISRSTYSRVPADGLRGGRTRRRTKWRRGLPIASPFHHLSTVSP
jgi:hypothetical protein